MMQEGGGGGEVGYPWVGLAMMPHAQYRRAIEPLLRDRLIDAFEWSCDIGWGMGGRLPGWVEELLASYAARGRLFGHGVMYSPTSAVWERRQGTWLKRLKRECKQRQFQHITEHFGFMTAGGALEGCPLPLPFTPGAVRVGTDRIQRMYQAAGGATPVGFENLALAMGMQDVENQGAFIEAMLRPLGDKGVMLLDLHNLYCQIVNFSLNAEEAIKRYPLHRVHAIHISGGSWCTLACDPHGKPFRRDTHDGDVPKEIISQLLPIALRLCPNLKVIILERLGETIRSERDEMQLRQDFMDIRSVVESLKAEQDHQACSSETEDRTDEKAEESAWDPSSLPEVPCDDEEMGRYQAAFLRLFSQDLSPEQLQESLRTLPDFAPFREYVEGFDVRCVEVASLLVHKWVRFTRVSTPWRQPWSSDDEDLDEPEDQGKTT